jgi:hypothetical protein
VLVDTEICGEVLQFGALFVRSGDSIYFGLRQAALVLSASGLFGNGIKDGLCG